MYSSDDETDCKLRRHIDDLLLEYAHEHLTTNFVGYTEVQVQEFFESLQPIPTHERGQLVLARDPFDVLKQIWKLDEIVPPEKDLVQVVAAGEVLSLLKHKLALPKKAARSSRVWDEDEIDFNSNIIFRPGTPLLSRSSQKASKTFPGKRRVVDPVTELPKKVPMQAVEVPRIEDAKVEPAEILDLKLEIGTEDRQKIASLAQLIPFLSRTQSSSSLPRLSIDFLRSRSPLVQPIFREISPPVFPRERRQRSNGRDSSSRLDLLELGVKHVEVPSSDGLDIAKENMTIVDGWTAIHVLSSQSDATPSLSDDQSEIDELDDKLWLPSSSAASMSGSASHVRFVEDAKMDVPLFPRAERFGGGIDMNKKDKQRSFSDFMASQPRVISGKGLEDGVTQDHVAHGSSPPQTIISLSMLGQAPSSSANLNTQGEDEDEAKGARSSFSDELEDNLKNVEGLLGEPAQSFQSLIMTEQLDEKETIYMEVPVLLPPNAHCKRKQTEIYSQTSRFAKVTGLKSLNLELSWRPFVYGTCVPTHEDVARVTLASEGDGEEAQAQALIANAGRIVSDSLHAWTETDQSNEDSPADLRVSRDGFGEGSSYLARSFDDKRILLLARSDRAAANVVVNAILPGVRKAANASSSPRISDQTLSTNSTDSPETNFADIPEYGTGILTGNSQPARHGPVAYDACHDYCIYSPKRRRLELVLPSNRYANESIDAGNLTVDPKSLMLYSPQTIDDSNPCQQIVDSPMIFVSMPSLPPTIYDHLPSPTLDNYDFQMVETYNGDKLQSINETTSRNSVQDDKPEYDNAGPLDHVTTIPKEPVDAEFLANSILFKQLSASNFLHLIGKRTDPPSSPVSCPAFVPEPTAAANIPSSPLPPGMIGDQGGFDDLLEEIRAFRPPIEEYGTRFQQTYLASLDVLQLTSLVRALESPTYAVRLVVRECISRASSSSDSGVDRQIESEPTGPPQAGRISFVVSPHAAVILFPLAALPSQTQYSTLLSSLSRHSWSLTCILVILTSFPSSQLTRFPNANTSTRTTAISPPIIKALRRVRRHLSIREGTGEKNAACTIDLSVANSVIDTAHLVRSFGERSLSQIPLSIDFNPYLGEEEQEGERDLAALECMNAYCAALILRCCTLDELIDMAPEERVSGLADLIGDERVEKLNTLLANRRAAVEAESSAFSTLSSDPYHVVRNAVIYPRELSPITSQHF